MNLSRRFVLGGLISAPAVIAADKLMAVKSIVKPYATVWGVGWDLEVVEHAIWSPKEALVFAKWQTGGIEKFREVTSIEYAKPMPSLVSNPNLWKTRVNLAQDWFANERRIIADETKSFTNVTSFGELNKWREKKRPDLDGVYGPKWAAEQIAGNRRHNFPVNYEVFYKHHIGV